MSIHVVLVDDSDIAASFIERIVSDSRDIRVMQRARSVVELGAMHLSGASVVLMDLWMPGRQGLGAIREIAGRHPVIVVSEAEPDGPVAREAVSQGARAFVSKRELASPEGAQRLRDLIRTAAARPDQASACDVVAIVGSTGAPRALEVLIPQLRGLAAAVVIVQHMPAGREEGFADWISRLGVAARAAKRGDVVRPGCAFIAPGGVHTAIDAHGRVALLPGDPHDIHVPSASALLRAASTLGRRLVAVVLSGIGDDGADAVAAIIERGGTCLVQDPQDAPAPSMPRAALRASSRVQVYPTLQLATGIRRACSRAN